MVHFHTPHLHTPESIRTLGVRAEGAMVHALFIGSSVIDHAIRWNAGAAHTDEINAELLLISSSLPEDQRVAFLQYLREAQCLPQELSDPGNE